MEPVDPDLMQEWIEEAEAEGRFIDCSQQPLPEMHPMYGKNHTKESRQLMSAARKGVPKSDDWKANIGHAHKKELEYKGVIYKGYDSLKESTGVSKHLYQKYYLNNIDPTPYINNRSHGMVKAVKESPPQSSKGKTWFNNGVKERYFDHAPKGWVKGRLKQ